MKITAVFLLAASIAIAGPPRVALPRDARDALPLDAAELPLNYRLHVEYQHSGPTNGVVRFGKDFSVPLAMGNEYDIAVEHPAKGAPVLRVWSDGKLVRGPEEVPALAASGARDFPAAKLDFGADFTAAVKFESSSDGALFS